MSSLVERRPPPVPALALALCAGAFVGLAIAAVTGETPALVAAVALAGAAALSRVPSARLEWRLLLAALVVVILFIPIRRYTFPGALPFALEPYRIVVAGILVAWAISILVDTRVRLRRSLLDGPVALIALAIVGSLALNMSRVAPLQTDVVKTLMFFVSFVLLFYLIVSVVRSGRDVDALLKLLVVGGAVIAVLAIVEYRTGFNAYDRALAFVPFLQFNADPLELVRSAGVRRAYGSAEHPIALGAMLAMLIPIALYVAKVSRRRIWWGVLLLLVFGTLATVSRTSILMLLAIGLVILFLRPREIKRLAPLAAVVFVLAQVAVPGSLGSLRYFFFPAEGLVAEQKSSAGSCTSSGRVADLGPSFAEYSQKPLAGYGFGTRIPTGPNANACILDNQWLVSLLDTGTAGALGFLWLFARFVRRLGRIARIDPSPAGWLPAALTASISGYAIGMLTFDAFSFIQVTFVMFVLLGLGAAVVANRAEGAAA